MKLLFAIKTMDSRGGGAERVLAQITAELADRGHHVTLLSFDAPQSPDFYAVDGRVNRLWLDAGRRQSRTSALDFAKRVRAIRKAARSVHPDVAVGFMHSAYVPLAFAMVGTGVPVVGSEHCVFQHYADRPADKIALYASAPLFAHMAAVSQDAKSSFPARLRKQMGVIPNPVASGASRDNATRRQIILNVGRLAHEKDQRTLIAAFARIADAHPGWKLRIVGEGSLRPELEEQARQLNIADRIELPGPASDVWDEYSRAQIFASSSTYESFGLAAAEALSAGLPIVGFAGCPGVSELIWDGVNGLLADPTDRVEGMAEALDSLIRSPEERLRMGAAALSTVSALSVGEIVDQWEDLLHRAAR